MTLSEETPNPIVLVVEDEPLVRTFAAEILMDAGYRVFEACDARDGVAILDGRDDIRAVVTDIEMPGDMDGLALALLIHERWPDLAIILTSGRIRPEAAAMPAGANFIAKPYKPGELVDQLAGLLAQHP